MLKIPVMYLIPVLNDIYFFDVNMKGRLIIPPTMAIPIIEPRPNTKIYETPSGIEFIVDKTKSINAALPAIPCINPTRNDL